jgi:hypothetical protein
MSLTASPLDLSAALTASARAPISSARCALLDERVAELLRTAGHILDGAGGLLREALRHLIEAGGHHLLQARRHVGEFVVDVIGLEVEALRQAVAGRGDGGGGAIAGGLEPIEQTGAALAERVDHGIAGMAERQGNVLALFGERAVTRCATVDLVGRPGRRPR